MMPPPHPTGPFPAVFHLRPLHDDEHYVAQAYDSHARRCARCGDPRGSPRLCERGMPLAPMVVDYLHRHAGSYFANHGHEGDMTNRVHLPASVRPVRQLLYAAELGLIPNLIMPRDLAQTHPDPQSRRVEIVERRPQHTESPQPTPRGCCLRHIAFARETRVPRVRRARPALRACHLEIRYRPSGSAVDIHLTVAP